MSELIFIVCTEASMVTVFSGGLWSLVKQSDATTLFILLLLLSISIVCWSLFLYTLIYVRSQRWHMKQVMVKIINNNDLNVLNSNHHYIDSLTYNYGRRALDLIHKTGPTRLLDNRSWELLQQQLAQCGEQLVAQQEFAATLLSTSASIAPLLGLLGTVWGLVHAFMNMAATQSADITAVAPGIAEALITTIAGLLVAIPALAMYNWTVHIQNNLRDSMYELIDTVIMILHKTRDQG